MEILSDAVFHGGLSVKKLVIRDSGSYYTTISPKYDVDSSSHGLTISTFDSSGSTVGGVIDLNNQSLSNANLQKLSSSSLGVAKTGGKGITNNSDGTLVVNHRESYSGLEFEDGQKMYVNVADQSSHPVNGTTPSIVFDNTGKLSVDDKAGKTLTNNNTASTSDGNANMYGWIGKLSTLGIYSGLINSVVLYRRSYATPNASTPLFLRLLKRQNNAWVVASQSTNSVKFGDQEYAADPIEKFFMKPIVGVEPPDSNETIAFVCVSDQNASPNSSVQFGSKVIESASVNGAITSELSNFTGASTETYNNYAPKMTVVWTPYTKDQTQRISNIESSLETLQNAVANFQTSLSNSYITLQYDVPADSTTVIGLPFGESVEVSEKDGDFITANNDGTITINPIA